MHGGIAFSQLQSFGHLQEGASRARVRRQCVNTLSAHEPENPEEKEIALSLTMWYLWVEQKQKIIRPALLRGEGAALFLPSPEKEQLPTYPGCPCQGRFIAILDYFGAGWKLGGATLLREARRTGLGDDSTWGGASLEDAGGRPGQKVDWGLACGGAMADGASRRGKMCLMASVCFLYCWELLGTVLDSVAKLLISARLSHKWRSWPTSVDIAFPRDHAVTFVAHSTSGWYCPHAF